MRLRLIAAAVLVAAPLAAQPAAHKWDRPPRQSPLPSTPVFKRAVARGCDVGQYPKEYWANSIKSVSWNGRCKDGKADSGKLVVTLRDGRTESFDGKFAFNTTFMSGRYQLADGFTYQGLFIDGDFSGSTITRPDGRVAFKGQIRSGKFVSGTVPFEDGATFEGSLDTLVAPDPLTGLQVAYGLILSADHQRIERYILASQTVTKEQHDATLRAVAARMNAESDAWRRMGDSIQKVNEARNAEAAARAKAAEAAKPSALEQIAGAVSAGAQIVDAYRAGAAAASTSGSAPARPAASGGSAKVHNPALVATRCVIPSSEPPGKYDAVGATKFTNRCGKPVRVYWCTGSKECDGNGSTTELEDGETMRYGIRGGVTQWAACYGTALDGRGFVPGTSSTKVQCW